MAVSTTPAPGPVSVTPTTRIDDDRSVDATVDRYRPMLRRIAAMVARQTGRVDDIEAIEACADIVFREVHTSNHRAREAQLAQRTLRKYTAGLQYRPTS